MAMIESASGLILRTRPLTETSLIVNWLTSAQGRISTVAKAARRPKSPFAGKLDLFYLADFSFTRSRRSELHTLREVSLRATHSALRNELGYLQQAAYCATLIEQATERDTPVSVFETVTLTFGSSAPVLSVTTPLMSPVICCARSERLVKRIPANRTAERRKCLACSIIPPESMRLNWE